ncbi:hypothetical protein PoB_000405400 [Plakobranchus ocellatus]|uniref:Uncharacterized protein n=1 Tax=Plakobranchus ocellatus TaxID=259542 RepID=A0AAV3Y3H7_9GAST|nr:hypothetical protein PoB_000405400 [Plakobranchus ocellatus]
MLLLGGPHRLIIRSSTPDFRGLSQGIPPSLNPGNQIGQFETLTSEPEMPSPPPYEECVNSKGVTSDISLYTPPTTITVTTHDQSSPNFSIYGNIPNEASPPTATIDPQTEQGKSTTN